jgi:uncharacterized protein DUF2795
MERGNTKHGPAHDQEMAHETEGMVRGSAQRAHGEEWRETEPVEGAVPPVRRRDGANPRPEGRDIELRSEFARIMTKDHFPADKDAIVARLTDTDAPPDLAQRVAELPAGRRFASPHDVMEALGINSPETNR